MPLEHEVWKLLESTYPNPTYRVIKHLGRGGEERWLPDFEVKKGEKTLLVVEVKEIRSTSAKTTFDSQMKRAFAILALNKTRDESATAFLVLPDDIHVPNDYRNIFLEIDCPVIRLGDVANLNDDWN